MSNTTSTYKPSHSASPEIIITPNSANNNDGGACGTSTNSTAENLLKWLFQDIDFIEESLEAVKRKACEMIIEVHEERKKLKKLVLLDEGTEGRDTQLKELKKKVSKLRLKIPFKFITPPQLHNPNVNWRPRPNPKQIKEITLRDLIMRNMERLSSRTLLSQEGRCSSVAHSLEDFELPILLCFLQFPPNAIVKRSILFGWVTASQFSHIQHFSAVREFNEIIDSLIGKGVIEAVHKKCSLTVAGYRMDHSTYYTLMPILYEAIEDDIFLGPSTDKEEEDYDVFYTGSSSGGQFSGDRYLGILHMGKWKKSSTQHIEFTDNLNIFLTKDVPELSRLRYISLRGISMIQELPEFITKLERLRFLDVQACYNLEVIPSHIANLRHTLRHLDMSECYFLEHMPKALATLYSLEVLKGFFVGEDADERTSCTLEDLLPLRKMVKLNFYTSVKTFPNTSELTALQKFESLLSLGISWGGCKWSPKDKYRSLDTSEGARGKYSFNLEKLDLQCVPGTVSFIGWLNPTNFKKLRRLYIRGGGFKDLGQWLFFYGHNESDERHTSCWNVEILRLKHLAKLAHLPWYIFLRLFPKVICVECFDCPYMFGFLKDDDSEWTKDEELSMYLKKNLNRV